MKKQIIESNTEPNKNCLWLTPNGLKRYGKSGWEDLTNGSGGSEDKVFEIKFRYVSNGNNTRSKEFMINGVGWFGADVTTDEGWPIKYLNGKEWENRVETIKEMFKDIESYNKLKLTELMPLDDNTEIPTSSIEELTYQFIDANGIFGIQLYSKVYTDNKNKFFLMANAYGDDGYMLFSW